MLLAADAANEEHGHEQDIADICTHDIQEAAREVPSEPRNYRIADGVDYRAGDTGNNIERSKVQNIDKVVRLAAADREAAEHLGKRHKKYWLVVDYRLDTRLDTRTLDGLHDSLFTDKEEPHSTCACDNGSENTHADKSTLKSKLDLISADKVKENGHYLLGQLLSEEAGGKVCNSDNSRSVNRVRGYCRLDTLLCDIAECSRAFTHDHEKKISDEFPDIVRTSARKYEGHEPINARTDCAGDTERNEIGLELAPAGSRLVNYRTEKHIVDNVPNTVDNIRYSLQLQADLKDVGDESLRIRVDIEALRHIIDDVSDSLFRTDIASVLKDVS